MAGIIIPDNKTIPRNVSNRNLLDNSWFTVNQRGYTEYYGGSGTDTSTRHYVGSGGYTVDRWRIERTTFHISVVDGGIQFGGSEIVFSQRIDNQTSSFDALKGKTITISAIIDGETKGKAITIPTTKPSAYTTLGYVSFSNGTTLQLDFSISLDKFVIVMGHSAAISSFIVRAIKLELGSVSTLANDVAPNYAEELLKCQRYFYSMDAAVLPSVSSLNSELAHGVTTTLAHSYIDGVKLRANAPEGVTVTFSGVALRYGTTDIAVTAIRALPRSCGVGLELTASGLTVGRGYFIRLNSGHLELSADL